MTKDSDSGERSASREVMRLKTELESLKDAVQELSLSEARYRGVIEDQTDLIVRWLPDGRRTFVNEAYLRYFGINREQAIGTGFLDLVAEEDRARIEAKITRLQSSTTYIEDVHRVLRPDGSIGWQHWVDRPIRDADGAVVEFQSVGRDVTRQRLLEEELEQARRFEAVGQMAGGIAHDFNNILTIIIGRTELLRMRSSPSDEAATEGLEEIRRAAEKASRMVRRLLALGRDDDFEEETIDGHEVIREVCELLRHGLGAEVTLKTGLEADRCELRVDRMKFEQILFNLIQNAGRALNSGGGTIELRTECEPGGAFQLTVQDDGPGIEPAIAERIFDPFFTTAPGRGSGLGLATVARNVRELGGAVRVESEPGAGAAFVVTLPLPSAQEDRSFDSGRRILVCEDHPAIRGLVERLLASAGHRVEAVGGAEEARRALAGEAFDLLLTDVIMAGQSGASLAAEVAPSVPVLFMSGYSRELLSLEHPVPADAPILFKPFSPQELFQAVDMALAEKLGNGT